MESVLILEEDPPGSAVAEHQQLVPNHKPLHRFNNTPGIDPENCHGK